MPRILFATNRDHPELTTDDRLGVASLRALGIDVEPVVWTEADAQVLDGADAVVIRSCWDYHLHPERFEGWVRALDDTGIQVINRPSLLRWNLHKRYLRDLAERGVEVVPTVWVDRGDAATLEELVHATGWAEVVIKPAVSLSAFETWRSSPGEVQGHAERFAALRSERDVLVQRFLPEVVTSGEWSLIFFGGRYSHAVRKRPQPGDFRVQTDHGGRAAPERPSPALVADAERAVAALPEVPLYARFDGVDVGGRLVLMELECIDPVLFLAAHPAAADRFARRLAAEIQTNAPR